MRIMKGDMHLITTGKETMDKTWAYVVQHRLAVGFVNKNWIIQYTWDRPTILHVDVTFI